jgi:thiol-disulfide isomerase/thioredoxin
VRSLAAALLVLATSAGALADAAPTVLDLRVTQQDASVVTLRTLLGDRAALVVFWATYCAPCRAEVPVLNRAAARWKAEGLRVVGVAMDPDAAAMRKAREAWGIRYDVLPIAADQDALADQLFPRGLPAAAFVARGSAALHDRLLDDATLEKIVPPLLEHAPSARQ